MRLLLDESVPRRLKRHLATHDVDSVHDRNWDGLKNGALLKAAEAEYDVLVTADQKLQFQQNLPHYRIRLVVLAGVTNRLEDLVPLIPDLLRHCETLQEGQAVIVGWRG